MERTVGEGRTAAVVTNTEIAQSQVFDGTSSKVSGFVMAYRLYLRIEMKGMAVEEQI